MPELTDAQKVNREATQKRIATALETLAANSEAPIGLGMTGASVGQVPVVKTVDANGVPTSYEPGAGGGAGIDLGLTGATVGDLVRVSAVDANGKPTSWKHVPLCEIACNPNLLDNWYFVGGGSQQGGGQFPINQRGQTSYPNAGYTLDRWKLTSGSVSLASGGITLSGTLTQIREQPVGRPVTASALLSDGTMITPAYNDSTKTFTLTASGQTVIAVKLELGSEQTLAHQENGVWVLNELPDYQQTLLDCMRFYQRIASPGSSFKIGTAAMYRKGRWSVEIPLAAPMKPGVPAVVLNGIAITVIVGDNNYFDHSIVDSPSTRLVANTLSFNINDSSVYTGDFVGGGMMLVKASSASSYIEISMDL